MQLCHTPRATSAVFDDPNLVSSAGLVPILTLARSAGLQELAQAHLSVPTDKGANAGLKVTSLVAGMVAGADSIDDMALLRHGGMGRVFTNAYAPSTLGSFLRSFTFGHVRQLDAVASRFLTRLAATTPLITTPDAGERVMIDIDDTIIEVHGYAKQGSGYGYSGVRGLAVDLDDGVVDVEHHPLSGARRSEDQRSLDAQASQEPGGHGVELTDVAEGERAKERSQRRGRIGVREDPTHSTVAQQRHVVDAVGAGDHPRDQ